MVRNRIRGSFFVVCALLLLLGPPDGLGASRETGGPSPRVLVKAKDDLLTLKATDAPLIEVLTRIVNETGIRITLHGEPDDVLTADFSDLPLDKGLRRLLKDWDYVLIYDQAEGRHESPRIREVIIYPGRGGSMKEGLASRVITPEERPAEEHGGTSFDSMVKKLKHKDPAVRAEAVDSLLDSGDRRALSHLTRALLNDESPEVRESAAEALGELGEKKSVTSLARALHDRDAGVRETAVDALAEIGGPEAVKALKVALGDENEDVREAAAEALEELTGEGSGLESVGQ